MRLLLVEDSARLSELLCRTLGREGFAVDAVGRADDAEAAIGATSYEMMLLDLGLPDRDGMELLREIRRRGIATPVLVLTSRDGKQDVVEGLNGGADDYLAKPFAMDELLARIRALLRRPGQPLGVVLRHGNIEFDTVERRIRVDGRDIDLSRRESGALECLMRRDERVVSKGDLEQSLYGFEEEVSANAIEVLIHRLRKKLSAAGASAEVHTLRGIGYILSDGAP